MQSNSALETLCDQTGVPPNGRVLIERIRNSPPSRTVQGGRGNVCVRYPSRKMGHIIQAESHTLEFVGIYYMEYDKEVLEYYDQPPAIKLEYVANVWPQDRRLPYPKLFRHQSEWYGLG
jgi:hypothetical protein